MTVHWPSFWLGMIAPYLVLFLALVVVGLIVEILDALQRDFDRLMTEPAIELDEHPEVMR